MRILRRTESPAQTADRVAIPETRAGFHHLFTLQKRISTCLDLFCRFWDIPFLIFDSYLPNVGRHAGERDEMPFASLTLLDNLRERPIFLGQLSDAAIIVVKTTDRMEDEPGAEHDQAKVQKQQRHEQRHHLPDAVIARSRD
jgi:hypothetical protein